jgi:hypothetical protein
MKAVLSQFRYVIVKHCVEPEWKARGLHAQNPQWSRFFKSSLATEHEEAAWELFLWHLNSSEFTQVTSSSGGS